MEQNNFINDIIQHFQALDRFTPNRFMAIKNKDWIDYGTIKESENYCKQVCGEPLAFYFKLPHFFHYLSPLQLPPRGRV